MKTNSLRPIHRSMLRLWAGKSYYRLKRRLTWYISNTKYALHREPGRLLPHLIFQHQSLLLRKLKDVDMQLQYNKITNLRLAGQRLNGLIVQPGETFSYWRLIGKPTRSKGYMDGMLLFYGKVMTGTGGGLCQLSNLIYWMTLHTPLTITERHRHSYDVFPDSGRSQPFGSGATCAYNYIDLQILNNTSSPYQLHIYLTETHLAGEWRSALPATRIYEVYEKEHYIQQQYWGGYTRHNVIHRKVYDLRMNPLDDEWITNNDAIMMYEPMLPSGGSEKTAPQADERQASL